MAETALIPTGIPTVRGSCRIHRRCCRETSLFEQVHWGFEEGFSGGAGFAETFALAL